MTDILPRTLGLDLETTGTDVFGDRIVTACAVLVEGGVPVHTREWLVAVNAVRQSQVTHCKKGHPYNAENTGFRPGGKYAPRRRCRQCDRERSLQYYRQDPVRGRALAAATRARAKAGAST